MTALLWHPWPVKCDIIKRLSDRQSEFTVMAHCYPCKRTTTLDPKQLLAKHGDQQIVELADRMKCGQCGERRYIPVWADSEPFG